MPDPCRALVRRAVYFLVKAEASSGGDWCEGCIDEGSIEEEKKDDSPPPTKPQDLLNRTEEWIDRLVVPSDSRSKGLLTKRFSDLYEKDADQLRLQILKRSSPCRLCRWKGSGPMYSPKSKQVSFDCSSLFKDRTEALGPNSSSQDKENGLYGYVNVIADAPEPRPKAGLVEVPSSTKNWSADEEEGVVPLGKRVIGSVGRGSSIVGVYREPPGRTSHRLRGRSVPSAPAGIEASRLDYPPPLIPYVGSLNSVSGSALDIEGAIYLPVTLGSVERRIPFAVVPKLHVDAILGTNALKDFRAVVDLDESLNASGEVFPLGSPRVEESYLSRISSTVRLRPGGQALVVAEIQCQPVDGTTVLVEGLAELDDFIKVAWTLCTVYNDLVIVEVCNPSIDDAVIKRSTRLASVTVIPETALPLGTTASLKHEAARPGETQTMCRRTQDLWAHSVISATSTTAEDAKESIPGQDRVLKKELKVDLEASKLGSEHKGIFTKFLQPFKDMFVETSMRPGRTSLLEVSIDTGDHQPIQQPPYRVSKVKGDAMESEIQEYLR